MIFVFKGTFSNWWKLQNILILLKVGKTEKSLNKNGLSPQWNIQSMRKYKKMVELEDGLGLKKKVNSYE